MPLHNYTRRGREFAQRLIEHENYRAWLLKRITEHTLDPSIERMLWAYAYGRPKEYVEVQTTNLNLDGADASFIMERARRLFAFSAQLNAATEQAEAKRLIAALEEEERTAPVQ